MLLLTSKLLIFRNEDAKEGEPQWTCFIAEREPKPEGDGTRLTTRPKPAPGDYGGIDGGDYPARRSQAFCEREKSGKQG
jgi:hypothetical protein